MLIPEEEGKIVYITENDIQIFLLIHYEQKFFF